MDYRTPDQYYSEQLVGSNPVQPHTVQPNELEQCMQLSMLEYIEQSIVDNQMKYSELYSKYKQIISKYKRLNRYDSSINDFTSYIEPIIDTYCQTNVPIELDVTSYTNIMALVNSIRLTKEEKELMTQLFSKN